MWIREYDIFLKVVICDNNIFNRLTGLALFKRSLFYVQVLYVTTVYTAYKYWQNINLIIIGKGTYDTALIITSSLLYPQGVLDRSIDTEMSKTDGRK